MSKIVGIDLGTTNSVVAVYDPDAGGPRVVKSQVDSVLTPSMVSYPEDGGVLVGQKAKDLQVTKPDRTLYSVKRFMGRTVGEVSSEEKLVPYKIVGKPHQYAKIEVGKRIVTPPQVSAEILRHLAKVASNAVGEPVTRAVITVPAHFNDAQRQATRDAGQIAGLTVERIINEPTAAALAYGLETSKPHHVVVFDFGGGTFDLSVMKIEEGSFRVLATHGDTHLGGDDFDQRIIDVLADDFKRRFQTDPRQHPMALQRLKQAAQQAKADLSSQNEVHVTIPYLIVESDGPRHLDYCLTRETFESVCTDLFNRLRETCKALLQEAGLHASTIEQVVMVGGATRIPMIRNLAREEFQVLDLHRGQNPDEVVACGAAILGGVINGELHNVNLMDVTSHSFGVENADHEVNVLIPKNTPIPTTKSHVFSTFRANQRGVDVHVLEGEETQAEDNRALGIFTLSGIPKAPAGVPRIEVTFDIDANGVLDVTAKNLDTGKEQQITVTGAYGLDDEEKEQLQEQAKQQVVQEQKTEQLVDMCNHGQRVLHDSKQWFTYHHHMLDRKEQAKFKRALSTLEKAVEKRNDYKIAAALRQVDALTTQYRKAG